MNDKLLTVSEAAARLRLQRQTLYRWSTERRVPTFRVGGRLLFAAEDLDKLVERSRRPAVGEQTAPAA